MTKISAIGTTETNFASVASIEGERGDGTSVKVPYAVLRAPRGCLAYRSSSLTGQNLTGGWNAVAMNAETYDTDSVHDNSTNPSRLTVPSGVTKVRLRGQVQIDNITADLYANVALIKNGAPNYPGCPIGSTELGSATTRVNVAGPVLTVTAGDYFELGVNVQTDTSVDVAADHSWIEMEIIA